MEVESGVTRRIINELHSWDIQRVQMEGETGVTHSIVDELQSWDIQGDQMEGERMVLLEVSLTKLILGMSKKVKWKVKVMLVEVSLMNFILRYSTRSKGMQKRCYSKFY